MGISTMILRLTFLLPLLTLLSSATAECACNAAVTGEPTPSTLSNPSQQVLSIAITQLSSVPAIPHFLALTTGSMFEAFQIRRGRRQLTSVATDLSAIPTSRAVAYAGYAALTRALIATGRSDQVDALDRAFADIGFGDTSLRDTIGAPIAEAVFMRFPLNVPPVGYTPPNRPSRNADAACGRVRISDAWQPLCVTPPSGGACIVQAVPFLPFVNASLITSNAPLAVHNLISKVPPPLSFSPPLRRVATSSSHFADDYRSVLDTSSRLDDRQKITAEVFAPNAALAVHRLALDEAATRGLGLARCVGLFFALSAGVRDGFVGSSSVKVAFSTTRPITVLQCGFRGSGTTVWRGPYLGTGVRFAGREALFTPYIQTPPFPGYVSGHTTISSAAATVLQTLLRGAPRGANCFIVARGGSVVEGRIRKGQPGFINGVTDVPNSGSDSVGFSPRAKVRVCWSSFREYSRLVAQSRRFGGVHTPRDNVQGERLGRRAGLQAVRFVRRMRRQR